MFFLMTLFGVYCYTSISSDKTILRIIIISYLERSQIHSNITLPIDDSDYIPSI